MIDRSERLVTIFGGSGFIGRYVTEYLMKAGVRLRIAVRDPRDAYFLQPLGQVGQMGAIRANVSDPKAVARAVEGADAVINLTGSFGNMEAVHVEGARAIAQAAKAAGAGALVHVSAIGADSGSDSDYARTKGRGEDAVRDIFPGSTIIRPSLVFGPEDALTNRFAEMARWPVLPILAAGTRFQPVYVRDLARAIASAALDPAKHGRETYEIGGPQVMTMEGLHRAILAVTGQEPDLLALPDFAGSALAWFGWLPGAPLTRDQWRMLRRDNVVAARENGLAAFGIEPTPLAAVAGEWLGRFRGGRFAASRSDFTTAA